MPAAKDNSRSMLVLVVSLLLAAGAFPALAQEKPPFAVLPFEAVDVSQAEAGTVSALFQSNLAKLGVYALLGESERDRILQDEEPDQECTDLECAVRLGRKLSVEQVALGTVARLGGTYIINAKIVEVASSRILAADSVKAAAREELDAACGRLTLDLVNRAMPGRMAAARAAQAEAGAEQAGQEAAVGGEQGGGLQPGTESTAPASAAGAAPESAEEKPAGRRPGRGAERPGGEEPPAGEEAGRAAARALRKADFWPLVTVGGGILLMEVGNVAGSVAFELRRKMSDAYVDYEQTSWNFEELWKDYSNTYFGYAFNTALAYTGWAAGLASIPTYLHLFPDRAFPLSRKGRVLFALGAGLSVAGNVLDLMACHQRYRNDFLYADYLAAGTDLDALYNRYLWSYVVYSVERLGSYALWLAGGAGMITSFFLPGEAQQPLSGSWDRTVLIGGASLVAAGSLTRTLALNYRQLFTDSGGYDERSYDRYLACTVLSYALWAAGGTGMLLPFIVDIGRKKPVTGPAETRPERLRLVPLPAGLLLQISW